MIDLQIATSAVMTLGKTLLEITGFQTGTERFMRVGFRMGSPSWPDDYYFFLAHPHPARQAAQHSIASNWDRYSLHGGAFIG